jgi:hypothetical protein
MATLRRWGVVAASAELKRRLAGIESIDRVGIIE